MLFGRKKLQTFYSKLLTLAHRGMNYAQASRYQSNGEQWVLSTLAKCFASQPVVLMDVGANRGSFTLSLINAFAPQTYNLHAFEPSADSFAMLAERVPAHPSVHLHSLALSDQKGEASLYADKPASTLASLHHRELAHHALHFSQEERVETDTLSGFCERESIRHIHLLKLDTEGHEMRILQGGVALIEADAVEVIQFEFGGCNIDSRTYFRDYFLLLNPRYRLFRIVRDGLAEITQYSERLEVFLSCNYLAIHRDSRVLNHV